MIVCSSLANISGIRHGFFGREGGVSEGLYASLNCGYGSGDNLEKVTENRRRISEKLGTTTPLLTCFQIHSPKVVTVAAPWSWKDSPEADALVTDIPNFPIGVLTADCLPVLFSDVKGQVVGAAHAGWKGAIGGILEATIHAMRSLGAENIFATIGPAIAASSYEVGAEFYERFIQESAGNAVYFTPSAQAGHHYFDLPAYGRARLVAAGIAQTNILAYDTRSLESEFFSYRRTSLRGENAYGRQLAAIMRME